DLLSLTAVAGPALTAAGKTLQCNSASGSVRCMASGSNNTTIGNGVVAIVTANLTLTSGLSISVPITNVMGALPDGTWTAMNGVGGGITLSAVVSSLSCSPNSVASGATSNCTVTLSSAAGLLGASVGLSSNNAALTVPTSVTVASGATTANFTATAGTVASNQSVTLTATLNGSATTSVTVTPPPPAVSSLSCSPNSVASAATTSCTVTLSSAALA